MGRKSSHKKHKDKPVKITADQVLSLGPLRIERFGRFVRFSNNSTPEQHDTFLRRTEEVNNQILVELENELSILQKLLAMYNPVEIMNRAAYMVLPLFIEHKSESEFNAEEAYFLPTVEYLQYLIARTAPDTNQNEISKDEWEILWGQALKIMHLTQSYLLSRKPASQPPSVIDELRFIIDGQRLIVRVHRYPLFFLDYLKSSLTPYEKQIKNVYGISVAEIIKELKKINDYQKEGVIGRYYDFILSMDKFTNELRSNGYAVDPGASSEEIERTQSVFETEKFKVMNEDMKEKARLTFTSAIFDITDLTSLPKSFLSLLSVKPGESILSSLTGPNHDDLSPLSISVLHYKPFLEFDGRFYYFYHTGFEDHLTEIIESDLFARRPGDVSVMCKRRSDQLESDTGALLSSIVCPDFSFQNVYYPNPDEEGGITELDVLMGIDDVLFLIEAKAGGISDSASRGAPKSIEKDLSNLIIEGQRQSERAEKYIKSNDEVAFFDETGKKEVLRLKHADFRRIFRIIVTRENLGWVGAKIAILGVFDPGLSKSYPWHVSIDDLRALADLFNNDEVRFLHYLELRLFAASEDNLEQHDELSHVGLYNKLNHYHELPVGGSHMSYDSSYMKDIDYYFMEKSAGEQVLPPTQEMSLKMKNFICALRMSKLHHRFEVGSILLSMDEVGRKDFQSVLDVIDSARLEGKHRSFRMPFIRRHFGLSISYASDKYFNEELKRSAVQMEQAGCLRWLVVQLADKDNYEILKIEVIASGSFTCEELSDARLHHEVMVRKEIDDRKPGRNDLCPCGSGKKYKKCHGF